MAAWSATVDHLWTELGYRPGTVAGPDAKIAVSGLRLTRPPPLVRSRASPGSPSGGYPGACRRRSSSAASGLSAARSAMTRRVFTVADPRCGRSTALSQASNSGWTSGFRSNTSSLAMKIWPWLSAQARACSSITGPREVLTSTAAGPSGLGAGR